jgi:hypothetical protein
VRGIPIHVTSFRDPPARKALAEDVIAPLFARA